MSLFTRLLGEEDGTVFDKFAFSCAFISIACVLGAHGLDRLGQSGSLPKVSVTSAKAPNVDYTPTGSIADRANSTALNPCGTR